MPHRSERQCRSDIDFYVQQQFWIEKLAAFDWESSCFFIGCVSGRSMLTTTFQYSLEAIAEMEVAHADETFMRSDEKELTYVCEEDDIGEDRMVYGWGPVCPIALNDGVNMCKSFKVKHNCCQSVVGESMARN